MKCSEGGCVKCSLETPRLPLMFISLGRTKSVPFLDWLYEFGDSELMHVLPE